MADFDIADIDLEAEALAGAFMQLRDPRNNQPIWADAEKDDPQEPCGLLLLGVEAPAVKEKVDEITKRRQQREQKRYDDLIEEGVGHKAAKEQAASTPKELLEDDVEMIATATTGWRHLAYKGDSVYTDELVREFYRNREWAMRQAQFFIANHANFMQGQGNS